MSIDDLAELAELANTDVEVISTETEEGQMLKNAFGGIAAMLRFKAKAKPSCNGSSFCFLCVSVVLWFY